MSRFTAALVVTPLADGKTWIVLRPFSYDVGAEGSADVVTIEVGFMTDFASIPRPFWVFLPKWGKYGNAAVVHDWLYWSQERSRAHADAILLEAMGVLGVPAWQKRVMYWAVRAFGGLAWRRNAWDRAAGFVRVDARVKQGEALKSVDESQRPGLLRRTWKHYRHGRESRPARTGPAGPP